MKMAKRYYPAIFFDINPEQSVWSCVSELYMKNITHSFTNFVEQIFKCHFDNVTLLKSKVLNSRKTTEAVNKA